MHQNFANGGAGLEAKTEKSPRSEKLADNRGSEYPFGTRNGFEVLSRGGVLSMPHMNNLNGSILTGEGPRRKPGKLALECSDNPEKLMADWLYWEEKRQKGIRTAEVKRRQETSLENGVDIVQPRDDRHETRTHQTVIHGREEDNKVRNKPGLSAQCAVNIAAQPAESAEDASNTAACGKTLDGDDEKSQKVGVRNLKTKNARRKKAFGGKPSKRRSDPNSLEYEVARRITKVYSEKSNRFPKVPESLARMPFYQKRQIQQRETDKQNRLLMKRLLQTKATVSSFR